MTEAEIAELRATWESDAAAARQARIEVSEAEERWRDAYFKAQPAYEALKAAEQAAARESPSWPGIGLYEVTVTHGTPVAATRGLARDFPGDAEGPDEGE